MGMKIVGRERRKLRIRKKVNGTTERPRLTVFRSAKHIYAQVIDDSTGQTLAHASTLSKDLRGTLEEDNKVAASKKVGALIGKICKSKQIDRVVFDLHRQPPNGRIEARALRYGPRLHHAVELQAEVVVEVARRVLLDDEVQGPAARLRDLAGRFGGAGEVTLRVVLGEGRGRRGAGARPADRLLRGLSRASLGRDAFRARRARRRRAAVAPTRATLGPCGGLLPRRPLGSRSRAGPFGRHASDMCQEHAPDAAGCRPAAPGRVRMRRWSHWVTTRQQRR